MPYSIINGTAQVVASNKLNISETLGGNVYLVQFNQMSNQFELNQQAAFTLPEKIYGHNTAITDKILDLFERNVGRTSGVMLEGYKGTGKTLTAAEVCIKANSMEIPVIIIQSAYSGEKFNDFMNSITEKCVVFIDEFEKTFKEQDNIDSVLQLLDGGIKTHKLFLMTSNSNLATNDKLEFLFNRPGRVYYTFKYGTLAEQTIQEFIDDCLIHKQYEEGIKALRRSFTTFTIDILKTIVTEVNRFGDSGLSLSQIMKDLNIKTDRSISSYEYDLEVVIDGKLIPADNIYYYSRKANPKTLEEALSGYDYYKLKLVLGATDVNHRLLTADSDCSVTTTRSYDLDLVNTPFYTLKDSDAFKVDYLTVLLDEHKWVQNEKTRALTCIVNDKISVTFTPILKEINTTTSFYI